MKIEFDVEETLRRIIREELSGTPGQSPDEWMTAKRAAAYLDCSVGRLHNLTSQRRLPNYRDGGRLLFRRSELDAYVESGRRT